MGVCLSWLSVRIITQRWPYRDEEARGAIGAVESGREKLQPCVVSVHGEFTGALDFHLGEPRVLSGQRRRGVGLVKVQNDIKKGRDGPSSDGLDAWHGNGRGPGICCKWQRVSFADQATARASAQDDGDDGRGRPTPG